MIYVFNRWPQIIFFTFFLELRAAFRIFLGLGYRDVILTKYLKSNIDYQISPKGRKAGSKWND